MANFQPKNKLIEQLQTEEEEVLVDGQEVELNEPTSQFAQELLKEFSDIAYSSENQTLIWENLWEPLLFGTLWRYYDGYIYFIILYWIAFFILAYFILTQLATKYKFL